MSPILNIWALKGPVAYSLFSRWPSTPRTPAIGTFYGPHGTTWATMISMAENIFESHTILWNARFYTNYELNREHLPVCVSHRTKSLWFQGSHPSYHTLIRRSLDRLYHKFCLPIGLPAIQATGFGLSPDSFRALIKPVAVIVGSLALRTIYGLPNCLIISHWKDFRDTPDVLDLVAVILDHIVQCSRAYSMKRLSNAVTGNSYAKFIAMWNKQITCRFLNIFDVNEGPLAGLLRMTANSHKYLVVWLVIRTDYRWRN